METIGKYLTGTWAAVISACLLLTLYVINPGPIQKLQLNTFDHFITSLEKKQSEEIVIVNFGEKSVEKFGQWPFDRRDIAKTIDKLKENGAAVIVMPVLFSEKDRAGGDNELAALDTTELVNKLESDHWKQLFFDTSKPINKFNVIITILSFLY